MKYATPVLAGLILLLAVGCGQVDVATPENELANLEMPAQITTQAGLISSFPVDDLPTIDSVEVLTSQRNETNTGRIIHEAKYVSNTLIDDLYVEYKSRLEARGWVEGSPLTQGVGTIQIRSGIFTQNGDTASVAIQTTVGENKIKGVTTVLLKIDQAQ